ncbi:MAG: class I SAM-dependent rRNA methyltransferase [Patescibacteria group bacterium]|jgi:23S rRNA (cytosine1962-C5)-methyltransferase
MLDKKIVLKRGREKAILNRHHWIFSGAIKSAPEFEDGDILPVFSFDNKFLGQAYFNRKTSIAGRMLSFAPPSSCLRCGYGRQACGTSEDKCDVLKVIEENVKNAIELRKIFFDLKNTNSYRLINSEGDFLPGLIVDKYNDVLVIQIGTLGMEKLKANIIKILVAELDPVGIYEKSDSPSRLEEGLESFEGKIFGTVPDEIEILENGNKFLIEVKKGQKTGFYFDQREMRKLVGNLVKNKKVLNCFSYTGGFSVYAMKSKALKVDSIDISKDSVSLLEKNFKLNNLDIKNNNFFVGDVFEYLRNEKLDYDFIILDPPAFCKTKNEIVDACRGYKEINRLAIEKIKPKSLILTCSCSYFVDEKLFQQVIFQAAVDANRKVRIIQKHHLALDHPINIFHPEGNYLKSLLLYIE